VDRVEHSKGGSLMRAAYAGRGTHQVQKYCGGNWEIARLTIAELLA